MTYIDRFTAHKAVNFCNLSIYRCEVGQYAAEWEAKWQEFAKRTGHNLQANDPERVQMAERAKADLFKGRGEWRFNQVTGVIALYISTHKVEGLLYHREVAVRKGMAVRALAHCGHFLDVDIIDEPDSAGIYRVFRAALGDAVAKSKLLKGRWIDYEPLNVLGPYTDWLAMSQSEHKRLHVGSPE